MKVLGALLTAFLNILSTPGKPSGYAFRPSRLAILYRDRYGVILGFVERTTEICSDRQTHNAITGLKKTDLFCLHTCRGNADLVVAVLPIYRHGDLTTS